MKSIWNAKADTAASIVLWAGGITAGLICVMWLIKHVGAEQTVIQEVDNELSQLREILNTACRMESSWKLYYPEIDYGTIIIKNLSVCIDSSACDVAFYLGDDEPVFASGRLAVAAATPCVEVGNCSRVHFTADNLPAFDAAGLTVEGALECRDRGAAFLRCRTLYCDTGLDKQFKLRGITFINISSKEDSFHAYSE